ncbi:hypothetical protein JL720_8160 [Aureococcus anophagefferens]|nr:hypothetical protein JL720_8160 [Aureococcus anophagefferens]
MAPSPTIPLTPRASASPRAAPTPDTLTPSKRRRDGDDITRTRLDFDALTTPPLALPGVDGAINPQPECALKKSRFVFNATLALSSRPPRGQRPEPRRADRAQPRLGALPRAAGGARLTERELGDDDHAPPRRGAGAGRRRQDDRILDAFWPVDKLSDGARAKKSLRVAVYGAFVRDAVSFAKQAGVGVAEIVPDDDEDGAWDRVIARHRLGDLLSDWSLDRGGPSAARQKRVKREWPVLASRIAEARRMARRVFAESVRLCEAGRFDFDDMIFAPLLLRGGGAGVFGTFEFVFAGEAQDSSACGATCTGSCSPRAGACSSKQFDFDGEDICEILTVVVDELRAGEPSPTSPRRSTRRSRRFEEKMTDALLSTVHKAKGGGWKRVYILQPECLPHPYLMKTKLDKRQEYNAYYVAITREECLYFLKNVPRNARFEDVLFPPVGDDALGANSDCDDDAPPRAEFDWRQAYRDSFAAGPTTTTTTRQPSRRRRRPTTSRSWFPPDVAGRRGDPPRFRARVHPDKRTDKEAATAEFRRIASARSRLLGEEDDD